jgi:hypothetical protein
MSLGTSIFFSSLVLAFVALFIATKDHWSWKKIILWPIASVFGLALLVVVWIYVRPYAATKDDVTFLKGKPTNIEKKVDWEWWGYGEDTDTYGVTFTGDRLKLVYYEGRHSSAPLLQGNSWVQRGSEDVTEKFGTPSHVSKSPDGTVRVYCYSSYNIFFVLEKNTVISYGLYNPSFGPVNFMREPKRKES